MNCSPPVTPKSPAVTAVVPLSWTPKAITAPSTSHWMGYRQQWKHPSEQTNLCSTPHSGFVPIHPLLVPVEYAAPAGPRSCAEPLKWTKTSPWKPMKTEPDTEWTAEQGSDESCS